MNHLPPIPGLGTAHAMQGWIDLVETASRELPDALAPSRRNLTRAMSALGEDIAAIAVSQSDAANLRQSQLRDDVILARGKALEGTALDVADRDLAAYRATLADTMSALERYGLPAGVKPGAPGDAMAALVTQEVLASLKTAGDSAAAIVAKVTDLARKALADGNGQQTLQALVSEPVRLYLDRCNVSRSLLFQGLAQAQSAAGNGGDVVERARLDLLGLSGRLTGLGDAVGIALYQARQVWQKRYAAAGAATDWGASGSGGPAGTPGLPLTSREPSFGRLPSRG